MAMIPSLLQLSFLSLFVILRSKANNDELEFRYHECNNFVGNFTGGSTYNINRDAVFSNIYSDKEIDYGFYNFSYGQDSDIVNAVGLCRGDIKPDECRSCLKSSAVLLADRCKYQKEAIGWYDKCMLRYSNESIFGVMVTQPYNVLCHPSNTTMGDRFRQTVQDLMNRLGNITVSGDSRLKFAEANATVQSTNYTIYALLQCTPDLSKQNCSKCLDFATSRISYFCDGRLGSRYMGPSCSARYETDPFFEPIVVDAPAPHPQTSSSQFQLLAPPPASPLGKNNRSRTAIAIVVSVVALVLLIVLICIYLRVRKPKDKCIESEGEEEPEAETDNDIKTTELLQYDFETIGLATNNFSDANKLGQGGFGTVYKGRFSDGQEAAIKRLSHNSGQGEAEFKNEVLLTGKLQHRNLVKLLGFCLQKRERLLIYEFVPNSSLDYFIFDPIKRATLDWERRYKIIKGIARGLLYLHEDSRLQIIHRNLKTSNILLDEELNPKISNFGIARLFDINQSLGSTKTIVGTHGYMAPEYINEGEFSVKSDVFSFGVIILEIVCGQKNRRENVQDPLISFAWKNWRGGSALNIADTTLNYGWKDEIMRCIHIGLLCVQEDVADRPTMATVSVMLNSSTFPLPDPSEPAFLIRGKNLLSVPSTSSVLLSEATRSSDSGSQSAQGSTNKSSISDLYPR